MQINITIPKDWQDELLEKARLYSYQENKDISYHDLIRRAIKGAFNLADEKFVKNNEI